MAEQSIFRKAEEDFPYLAETVPFIWVSMSGEMDWGARQRDKFDLLTKARRKARSGEQGILLGVWPGKWTSDVFELDLETAWNKIKAIAKISWM